MDLFWVRISFCYKKAGWNFPKKGQLSQEIVDPRPGPEPPNIWSKSSASWLLQGCVTRSTVRGSLIGHSVVTQKNFKFPKPFRHPFSFAFLRNWSRWPHPTWLKTLILQTIYPLMTMFHRNILIWQPHPIPTPHFLKNLFLTQLWMVASVLRLLTLFFPWLGDMKHCFQKKNDYKSVFF